MVYVYMAVKDNVAGIHIQRNNGELLCDAVQNCDTQDRKYTGLLTAMQLSVKKLMRLQTSGRIGADELIRVLVPSQVIHGWCKAGRSESYAAEFEKVYTGFEDLYADVEFICVASDSKINRALSICANSHNAFMQFKAAFGE